MPDAPRPAVSITLATWNGLRWLPGCLDSIASQTLSDYELLIRDDGSTDGTVAFLQQAATRDPRIEFTTSGMNQGYVRTQNALLGRATGEAVLPLNQDVELDARFLEAGLRALRDHPEAAAVQGRVLRLGAGGERLEQVDTTGLVMHRDRRVVSRDQLRSDAAGTRPAGPVWGADGPAPLYRRTVLEAARMPDLAGGWEVFDSDFGSQKEDVDLAWRVRTLGWEAWYEPAAIAWHARTGADSAGGPQENMANPLDARVRAWRNQRLMQLKNDELIDVLRDLPWIARRELAIWAWMLLADQRRLRAFGEFIRLAPRALRKRRALRTAVAGGRGAT